MTGRTRFLSSTSKLISLLALMFFLISVPLTAWASTDGSWANAEVEEKLQEEMTTLFKDGKHKEALRTATYLVEVKTRMYGYDHVEVAAVYNTIGDIYFKDKNFADAEINYLRALNLYKQILGTRHAQVASVLHSLGDVYRKTNVSSRAEQYYKIAIRIREDALDRFDPKLGTSLNNLAELYKTDKKYKEAEPYYQRALEIFERAYPADHKHISITVHNLADLYRIQENYDQALPLYTRLLELTEKTHNPDDPKVQTLRNIVAELTRAQIPEPEPASPSESEKSEIDDVAKLEASPSESPEPPLLAPEIPAAHEVTAPLDVPDAPAEPAPTFETTPPESAVSEDVAIELPQPMDGPISARVNTLKEVIPLDIEPAKAPAANLLVPEMPQNKVDEETAPSKKADEKRFLEKEPVAERIEEDASGISRGRFLGKPLKTGIASSGMNEEAFQQTRSATDLEDATLTSNQPFNPFDDFPVSTANEGIVEETLTGEIPEPEVKP